MDNRSFDSGATVNPPAAPAAPSAGFPTNGDPLAPVPPTVPGAFWFHQVGEELRNVIAAAGLAPSSASLTQLYGALQLLYSPGNGSFLKIDAFSPAFFKAAAGAISIKANTSTMVAGVRVAWAADTAVTMPVLTGGVDYAIYVCADGTIRADASFTAPTGYTTANSRMIGGFHYGLVAPATTVGISNGFSNSSAVTRAGTANGTTIITGLTSTADLHKGMDVAGAGVTAGTVIVTVDSSAQVTLSATVTAGAPSLTFTNTGMVWAQTDVDNIAGINKFSIWDSKFRPKCDPRGMALVGGQVWMDIYLCSTDTAANGTSKAGTNIASGTVLPKIPAAFGGNGATTYPSLNWWVANELARASQKRLMWESEFVDAAFGVMENNSIDATASTYPATQHNLGYTSKYGIEQVSGHHWVWGQDSSAYQDVAGAVSWKPVNGNTGAGGSERGGVYTFGVYGLVRVILGGARTHGALSGSRCSGWVSYPWYSFWSFGLRAACDHMISV